MVVECPVEWCQPRTALHSIPKADGHVRPISILPGSLALVSSLAVATAAAAEAAEATAVAATAEAEPTGEADELD